MINFFEKRFKLEKLRILGIDEAGRGNLAGPMVVAGCILNKNISQGLINSINDSKKISKQKRALIYQNIIKNCNYYIEIIDVNIINKLGPKKASIYGMNKIIKRCNNIDLIITDFEKINSNITNIALIHGDAISLNVAAASIIAKYTKDNLMMIFLKQYPKYEKYDFANNAGYGTAKHLEALEKYGKILNFHRINYEPVKKIKKINLDYNK